MRQIGARGTASRKGAVPLARRNGRIVLTVALVVGTLGAAGVSLAAVPQEAGASTTATTFTVLKSDFVSGGTITLGTTLTAPAGTFLAVGPAEPVTLDLNGHHLSITQPSDTAAVSVPDTTTFTLTTTLGAGGELTAAGGTTSAGIGGDKGTVTAGHITIDGGAVQASGRTHAAGIGGDATGYGGVVVIDDGTVTATGGASGAGIGGGSHSPGTVTINGGTVHAHGGTDAAGIGGGSGTSGPSTITIDGGTVTAVSSNDGAGIGAGTTGPGGTVTIGSGATVTASTTNGLSVIGADDSTTWSFSNAGTLTIPTGSELVLTSASPADNSGTIYNHGSIIGNVDNTGTIDDDDYTLDFTVTGVSSSKPATLHVFATSVTESDQTLPSLTLSGGLALVGWVYGGATVTDKTTLPSLLGTGPVAATLLPVVLNVATTFAELKADFLDGGTYVLGTTITAPGGTHLVVGAGKSVTLDLSDHVLAVTGPASGDAAVDVPAGTSFTVEDPTGSGTLSLDGGHDGAGIGGDTGETAGTVTIDGGYVTSFSSTGGAGIGGGFNGTGGTVTIKGGGVSAVSTGYGAGIGGGAGGDGGTVTIKGGKVTAIGRHGGAGIGGGSGGSGGAATIDGGTVTAHGTTDGGAGIGGGDGGDGGTVTINGGTVTARGSGAGTGGSGGPESAGIGGGATGKGGDVTIASGAVVVADAGSGYSTAIGRSETTGFTTTTFGSLTNAGTLTLQSAEDIPTGTTVTNTGVIHTTSVLGGAGTLANTGIILLGASGSVGSSLDITENSYTLTFTVAGVPGTPGAPAALQIYAPDITAAEQALPGLAVPSWDTFNGWAYDGSAVADTTDLRTLLGAGPDTVTLDATITAGPITTFTALKTCFGEGGTCVLGTTLTAPAGTNLAVGTGKSVTLDLESYKLTVSDPPSTDAAVGVPGGTSLTVEDTTAGGKLVAAGNLHGAGIGGGHTQSAGSVTIDGGTVTSLGGPTGAGIGGGWRGSGGTVTVHGGKVTAGGGTSGAGIGGGTGAAGGTITIDGGTVTATGGTYSAGLGGGLNGAGGTVTIASGGHVTASDGGRGASAVGNGGTPSGSPLSQVWSFTNAGTLTIPSGSDLVFPAGMTATNSGTVHDHGTVTGTGTLTNTGTIVDVATPTGTVSSTLDVTDDDYTLDFTVAGVPGSPGTPATLHVYAPEVTGSEQVLPELTVPAKDTFNGWTHDGSALTDSTNLPTSLGAGPETVTLEATVSLGLTTFAELEACFQAGGTCVLGASITAPDGTHLVVGTGKSVTLDLSSYELTVTQPAVGDAGVAVPSGTSLIVEDTGGGGELVATGGPTGAGIGGDGDGSGGTVTIDGGTVIAGGGTAAAGIGGGAGLGDGGTVVIASAADVTSSDGGHDASAVGDGGTSLTRTSSADWSFSNSGMLTIPSGSDLIFPAGTAATNSGTVHDHGTVTGTGTLTNAGTIVDAATPAGTVSATLTVDTDDYTLDFTVTGVPGSPSAPAALHLYASSVAAADETLPGLTVSSGYAFEGWSYDGKAIGGTTNLSTLLGAGPKTVTLFATVTAVPITTFTTLKGCFEAGGTCALGTTLTAPDGTNLAVGTGKSVTLQLEGHVLTVPEPTLDDAAVEVPAGTSLTIRNATGQGKLFATSTTYGAGIGGGVTGASGAIVIDGGTITANGGGNGAGIGGGSGGGAVGPVTINGGTVIATGDSLGAGIGGGGGDSAGIVAINGGTVIATGGTAAAGIGGGAELGDGGTISLGVKANVTAVDGGFDASAVGDGGTFTDITGSADWDFTNAGTLTIPSGSALIFPAGMTATNPGTIVDHGSIEGTGTLDNTGTIVDSVSPAGTVGSTLSVDDDNYALDFTVTGVPGTPAAPGDLQVYAEDVTASDQALPGLTVPSGYVFNGWVYDGSLVSGTTDLTTLIDAGPRTATLTATVTSSASSASSASTPMTPAKVTAPTGSRIAGTTAAATAAAELAHQFTPEKGGCPASGDVVLVSGGSYTDALSSQYLASYLGSGTLLTLATALPAPTKNALKAEGIFHVFVVGGPLAVTTAVVTALEALPVYSCGGETESGAHLQVTRVSGLTAYATAAAVDDLVSPSFVGSEDFGAAYTGENASGGRGKFNATAGHGSAQAPLGAQRTAILATSTTFQDAESGSVISYEDHFPILLTEPSSLPEATSEALESLDIRQVVVLGGPLAISDSVVDTLEGMGISVLRVAGATYVQTSTETALFELSASGLRWTAPAGVTVADGSSYTDGVAGAVVAAGAGKSNTHVPEPVLLTESPTTVGVSLESWLEEAGGSGGGTRVDSITVLGGALAVTTATLRAMLTDLGG